MNDHVSSLYLGFSNTLKAEPLQTKEWLKAAPFGINKLISLLKTMAKNSFFMGHNPLRQDQMTSDTKIYRANL